LFDCWKKILLVWEIILENRQKVLANLFAYYAQHFIVFLNPLLIKKIKEAADNPLFLPLNAPFIIKYFES